METIEKSTITVEATVNLPVEKVWEFWTKPEHITEWCSPSDDWHAPHAENDLRAGGRFKTTMAARDGSVSFDFEGVYTSVEPYRNIEYTIDDGRRVQITFLRQGHQTKLIETFEAEDTNPLEMQRGGWQAILDNFNSFVENFK
ncbi:MAG TPA: SRPBCC family protein [Chryseosolibacter sp.]|nr:SRPBCC family protein [Chryseosolibacter sp.]